MAILYFELSMPSNNAWNGRWSGEGRKYVVTKNLGKTKRAEAKAKNLSDIGYFTHNFGDGCCAGVSVRIVDAKEATRLRKLSNGFCGYNWMIDSILMDGKIAA